MVILNDKINRRWNNIFREDGKGKKKTCRSTKNYRKRKAQNDPEYKEKVKNIWKNTVKRRRINTHQLKKQLEESPPKTVLIPSIKDDIREIEGHGKDRKKQQKLYQNIKQGKQNKKKIH